jgi:DNA polymerase-3 subunit delta'
MVFERLNDQIHAMALRDSAAGRTNRLDRWSQVWSNLAELAADTEALNLDRADALWTAVAQLRAAAA